ncbi:MAG: efflux RND transporter periplasmic adaptor subunit [Aquificaceae bacterium]
MKPLVFTLLFIFLSLAQEIKISAIVQGRVEKVLVKEGQRVNKGDLLVLIDPLLYTTQRDSLMAQMEAQKIAFERAERDFKRHEELFNRGLLSRSEYENWKSKYQKELYQYEALKAQLQRVEALIDYCTIKAPTRGVVKRVLIREGSFVNGSLTPHILLILEEK